MGNESGDMSSFYRIVCEASLCSHPNASSFCAKKFPDMYRDIVESMRKPENICMESKIMLTVLYSLLTTLSLVGNSLVIITFVFDKHMRSVTNVFILSLAVTDLMVTLACVPINIGSVFSYYWIFGAFACKLVPFSMTFSVSCSSLTLCSIAMDRYVAIVHPHKLKFLQNPKPAGIFLVAIWLVSLLCSLPNLVFYDVKRVEHSCSSTAAGTDYICVWPQNRYKLPLELWLTFIVLFIVPFVIMSWAYGMICYTLWIRKPVGQRRNSLRNADMKKSVIKMLVIVVLVFLLCWSPIMIFNAVEKTSADLGLSTHTMTYLKLYFQCLSLVSCCINPIIYTFMNKKFRQKFASYLFCRKSRVGPLTTGTIKLEENTC